MFEALTALEKAELHRILSEGIRKSVSIELDVQRQARTIPSASKRRHLLSGIRGLAPVRSEIMPILWDLKLGYS
jgi:hypothetical protein